MDRNHPENSIENWDRQWAREVLLAAGITGEGTIPDWERIQSTNDIEEEAIPDSFPIEIEPDRECSVCQEGSDLLSLGCRHTVCNSCIRKLPRQTCPQCRESIAMRLVRKRK